MNRALVISVALVPGLLLVGCSSSDSTQDANAAYCSALNELSGEVATLTELVQSNATVEQLQNQRLEVQSSARAVSVAADQVDSAVSDQIDAAEDSFNEAIDTIPSDATVQEAAAAYSDAAADYNNALRDEFSQLGCQ